MLFVKLCVQFEDRMVMNKWLAGLKMKAGTKERMLIGKEESMEKSQSFVLRITFFYLRLGKGSQEKDQ